MEYVDVLIWGEIPFTKNQQFQSLKLNLLTMFLRLFFLFFTTYLRTMNNLQVYSSLSILSTYEVGYISMFMPYWLHHIGYK